MLLKLIKRLMIVFILLIAFVPATKSQEVAVQFGSDMIAVERQAQLGLGEDIRRRLVTLPFYDVFDWLEGELKPDGTLVLRGQVTRPTLKSDAEHNVRDLPGVSRVINEIEVLPAFPADDRLRLRIYRAIYNLNSPLARYAVRAVPPIHIIVNNGRVTLRGTVATAMESRLAETYARQVSGSFEVRNELRVEQERPL